MLQASKELKISHFPIHLQTPKRNAGSEIKHEWMNQKKFVSNYMNVILSDSVLTNY
jgi:hypothetical protein